jgi:hypothetical protein
MQHAASMTLILLPPGRMTGYTDIEKRMALFPNDNHKADREKSVSRL